MLPAIRNNSGALNTRPTSSGRLSSFFDRFFNDEFFAPLGTPAAWSTLPVAMWEDEQNVHVEVDAPGVTDKDIELSVHNGALILRGERKCHCEQAGYDTRSYGRFEQWISLPAPVEADKVEARLVNGVLKVTFPKTEQARPRKIALKSE